MGDAKDYFISSIDKKEAEKRNTTKRHCFITEGVSK
jgi:hypothetical protein